MKTKTEVYKGINLTHGRTVDIIDTIIKNRNNLSNKELAELVGFETGKKLAPIFRVLDTKKPKYVVKTAKNTYSNYSGSGKDKARQLIAKAIMTTKRQSSNILTLPADKWIMERNILKQKNGYKFTAVERDKETFQKMVINATLNQNLFDSVLAVENKSIGEVIENVKADTYSSAILDYCGFIDSFYDEIDDMMKRKLVKKDGFIAITLSENDRSLNNSLHSNGYSYKFVRSCYADDENPTGRQITTDLINTLIFNNKGYKLTVKQPYKDKTNRMLLFVIQRIDD